MFASAINNDDRTDMVTIPSKTFWEEALEDYFNVNSPRLYTADYKQKIEISTIANYTKQKSRILFRMGTWLLSIEWYFIKQLLSHYSDVDIVKFAFILACIIIVNW